ncbi:glycoside hydrolase family 125 protein [Litorihabitans aurantiacus]|uniref:Glycoside hydrolase family 125 protein n=1 Tax=Litorihabitans aurantiacus TaxID=1930061 RepID=A0AA37XF19_9MICO|nr:glycoside hydrolase family 125 protein [Litorihabitans aurantiacus]GMA32102.1 hypothetical protein GCM10025875_20940 [Litorihabitans aurantiacus]
MTSTTTTGIADPAGAGARRPVPPDVEHLLADVTGEVRERLGDDVAAMTGAALRRTLERTLTDDDLGVFVITGDIPAMWLRDSTTQLLPYLRLLEVSPAIADLVADVARRQTWLLAHDPYANAFNPGPTGARYDPDDLHTDPWVWEQKYEIDSLALPILLAHRLWRATGRTDHLDERAHTVARTIVAQVRLEQHHEERSPYRFERPGAKATETLVRGGLGAPTAPTGMTWSGFRPSDDACTYGYNVPGNLVLAQALGHQAEIAERVWEDAALASDARALATEISGGVARHGVARHPRLGPIYAYEVDGLGAQLLMDDANMPSLLSLPLLAPDVIDPDVTAATRAFVLSEENPWFFSGSAASGVGSPHTGPDRIWPIAIAVEGLTTDDLDERRRLLRLILDTDGGTGHVHEGFDSDDPSRFSRPWFSWADSMFCELALDTAERIAPLRGTRAARPA